MNTMEVPRRCSTITPGSVARLAYLRMRGIPLEDLIVVEFCETSDDAGFYRKYSIFRIGDACPLPAHRPRLDDEESHPRSRESIREEMDYLRDNPI